MAENRLEWDKATQLIESAHKILLVTHVFPDGDALGSTLGLANALRAAGKSVDAAVDDGTPKFLSFLPSANTVYPKLTVGEWDVMISLDASDEERTGFVGEYGREHSAKVINLDHHITNTYFGDVYLVQVDAVSSTEVVYRWLKHMGITPNTRELALPLLTGLVTDTIGFRTSNVKPEILGIAQELMNAGVSISEIAARTLDNKSYKSIRLWAEALHSIELDGEVVIVTITQADMKNAGVEDVSDSGLVSLLNQISEAMIAVIFWELPDGKVKLNLRSKHGYDVGSVAMSIGGGGHKQAAGATIDGPLPSARERVMPRLHQAVSEGTLIIA